MTLALATVDDLATEDLEEVAKWQARLDAEAIVFFDAHISEDKGLSTFINSPMSMEAAYLFDVATRLDLSARTFDQTSYV